MREGFEVREDPNLYDSLPSLLTFLVTSSPDLDNRPLPLQWEEFHLVTSSGNSALCGVYSVDSEETEPHLVRGGSLWGGT